MAKLVLGNNMLENEQWSFMVQSSVTIVRKTNKSLIYTDGDGDTVAIYGENLKYSGDAFSGGRITEVVVRNVSGDIYGKVTGLDLKAADMFAVFPPTGSRLRDYSLSGNDTIFGSSARDTVFAGTGHDRIYGGGNNDRLHGMEGNDTLTGGKGIDTFYFLYVGAFGRDRVTDFDLDNEQLGLQNDDFFLIKDGDDTILDFVDGSRIRLDDVKPVDFTADHYFLVP